MRRSRLAAATGLLVLAAAFGVAAHELFAWRAALSGGDARFGTTPAAAQWSASTWLPRDPAERLLALGDDLAIRRAVRAFVVAEHTPRGFDNGEHQSRVRASAEAALTEAAVHGSGSQASQADDLMGVLVATAGRVTGGVTADDRARDAFESAVRADPRNGDAKYNLELLLRRTRVTGTRRGPGSGSGPRGTGRRGAGAGTPGRGY
jgi:hypothetical protein